jgi:hypothetical protein
VGAAAGTGQSFTTLDQNSGSYSQELYATALLNIDDPSNPSIFGVAFAPNGDPWVSECVFADTTLHRFAVNQLAAEAFGTTSRHAEVMTVASPGGCGLTNNRDGHLYSNSQDGVWTLDASTGLAIAAFPGPRGNALGITSDPRTGHVVYVGATCHPFLLDILGEPNTSTTCDIYDLNQATGAVTPFARLDRTQVQFVDGIYFDPTGTYLFVTTRNVEAGVGTNSLVVVRRPEDSDPTVPGRRLVPRRAKASRPLKHSPLTGGVTLRIRDQREGSTRVTMGLSLLC